MPVINNSDLKQSRGGGEVEDGNVAERTVGEVQRNTGTLTGAGVHGSEEELQAGSHML